MDTSPPPQPVLSDQPARNVGRLRWVICALLFAATTVNYVDRSVFGVLEPTLQKEIRWTDSQFGYINACFPLAYAIGFLIAGWLIDRLGTRIGYAISLTVWSIAAAGHALARTSFGFGIARFALGLAEAGNFPAAIKTTAEWFPRKERAFATGIFNAGSNVGAILAPLLVPIIALRWGWQWAFIGTGIAGLIWVAFWWPLYRRPEQHPRISPTELQYIQSDQADSVTPIRWRKLFPHRQTWAFALGKFLTDAVWWFYLFWFAKFMSDRFGVSLKTIGPPMVTVYLLADVGSVAGGWLSSRLLKLGWTPNAARKIAMLVCALFALPVAMAAVVPSEWVAVILIGVAAAAHQGYSANLFTLASDMFPRRAVGSVVGIGGMAGALGGFFLQLGAGVLKTYTGNYFALFLICGCAYLCSLLVIHVLAPRLEPAAIEA